MMKEGMSYSEYVKLKKENEEELARLYFFVLERKKKEKEELDKSKNDLPSSVGGQRTVVKYAFARKEDYDLNGLDGKES